MSSIFIEKVELPLKMSLWFDLLTNGTYGTRHNTYNPYPAGPQGRNGTQQFPKLTSKEIWDMAFKLFKPTWDE